VDADDLIEDMVATAREMSAELGKLDGLSAEEQDEICHMVGLGALKYFILKVDPKKTMLFNPRESIDFNGNTGPFIQYTYARIRSVLRKAAEMGMTTSFDGRVELIAEEVELVKYLADFPQTVLQAGASYSPSIIGAYVYDLAKMYNSYYHDHSILREEREDVRQFRVALSSVVAATIGYGMSLMGIEVPERM
jgi:arginyl-tRNA synthetase